ncbi:rod shape-determining protein MreD [Streptococcus porcinus]|uniref:Rod shape-determining protein MreD n=1 Tax=Streptococcus porcinus TaxID=1340 RepID=A0A7V9WQJ2_STRPO|nr:rod shape-determining protein MreD [Streptococcus porcinus]MBA2795227.1 rod shape-determining protein MreD [Streptococcus porcinus]
MNKRLFLWCISAIPLLLLDAHITHLFSMIFVENVKVNSAIFLIFLFFISIALNGLDYVMPLLAMACGLVYDYYYFDQFGIMIIAFPVYTLLTFSEKKIFKSSVTLFQSVLLFSVNLCVFYTLTFMLLQRHHLMNNYWSFYITYHFLPSLIFNVSFFVIIYKQLNRFFY